MKRVAILSLVILCATTILAQTTSETTMMDTARHYLEISLSKKARNVLEKFSAPVTGEKRAQYFNLLGQIEEFDGFSVNALSSFKKALPYAKDKSSRAASLLGIASAKVGLSLYDSTAWYLDEAWSADSTGLSAVTNYLVRGRYWQSQNEIAKSLDFYQQAEKLARQSKFKNEQALALSGMASTIFSQDAGMKRVTKFILQANALIDSTRQPNILARNYARLANVNMVLGDLKRAEQYLRRAKTITDITENLPVKSYVMSSLSILKSEQGDLAGALSYAKEPARIKRELKQHKLLQNDLLNIAEYEMWLKKYDDAYKTLAEGLALSESMTDYLYQQYFHERLARVDSMTGKYQSAFTHLQKALVFKDSVVSFQRMHAVDQLQEKYEAEQRDKMIAEKEIVIQRQRYSIALIAGVTIIAVVVSVLIFVLVRQRHRSKLEHERQAQHRIRLQTIVNTQEEVQQRIARDIHDGLVQIMGAAKLSLSSIPVTQGVDDKLESSINRASDILDEACQEARTISHQLLPYSLMKDGLVSAIEDLLHKSFPNYELEKGSPFEKISTEQAIHVYRIAQEIINNVIKHAGASRISVRLSEFGSRYEISFQDNGRGFDNNDIQPGAGLLNIQTRAELINAELVVRSVPNEGTTITLTFDHA